MRNEKGIWYATKKERNIEEKKVSPPYGRLGKDVLENLQEGPRTYEGLKQTFPGPELTRVLLTLETRGLVRNEKGIWYATERVKKVRKRKVTYSSLVYLLVIPVLYFSLLSYTYYTGYTDLQIENQQLLREKAEIEAELSGVNEAKKTADAGYRTVLAELENEQGKTSQLQTSYGETETAVVSLQDDLDYYDCLEKCTPDKFVTVDNPYVKAKVDEITSGLTTLREKQEAIFNFVRDHIEEDESIYRFGRIDFWEYPEDILKRGKGHYEDKYLLLVTMLRIAGTPPDDVRFVAADVDGNDNWVWVEAYDGKTWWILDPIEEYMFTTTPLDGFYSTHRVVILWWFNDEGYRRG